MTQTSTAPRATWRTLDEVKAESVARNAAVFVAFDGHAYAEWRAQPVAPLQKGAIGCTLRHH